MLYMRKKSNLVKTKFENVFKEWYFWINSAQISLTQFDSARLSSTKLCLVWLGSAQLSWFRININLKAKKIAILFKYFWILLIWKWYFSAFFLGNWWNFSIGKMHFQFSCWDIFIFRVETFSFLGKLKSFIVRNKKFKS